MSEDSHSRNTVVANLIIIIMPLYTPVAQYNFDSEESGAEEDEEEEEEEELSLGNGSRRQFFAFASNNKARRKRELASAKEDRARAELDGNRPRLSDPLTIIQVKNISVNSSFLLRTVATMSVSRRICLAASTLALLVFVVLFLWVLPCKDTCTNRVPFPNTGASTAALASNNDDDWVRVFNQIVLISGLEVVISPSRRLVVAGYQQNSSFGLLAIEPLTGEEVWRHPLFARPVTHNCNLLDVDGNGAFDCLVVGEKGLLAAIEPRKGSQIWSLHHHIPLVNLSLPRRLPDLNGDGVAELVAACAVTLPSGVSDHRSHQRTNLVLLSGADGAVIGRPYLAEMCTDLVTLNVTDKFELRFDCVASATGEADQFEMTLEEFFQKVTQRQLEIVPSPSSSFNQFGNSGGPDGRETVKDSIHLDWTPLSPNCRECGVNVKLWDGFAHYPLWNRTWRNAIVFQPLSTRFETERWDSPIEGFVFRLWEWEKTDLFKRAPAALRTTSTSTTMPSSSVTEEEEEEEEEDEYSLEKLFSSDRNGGGNSDDDDEEEDKTRSSDWMSNMIPFGHPNLGGRRRLLGLTAAETRLLLKVTESIFYVTLNHTTPQVVRLYSERILQQCNLVDSRYSCNPHYDTQPSSMVIIERPERRSSRDLIFASQSLVGGKRTVQTTLKKLRLDVSQR